MTVLNFARRDFIKWFVRGSVLSALGYPILIEPNWPILEKIDVPIDGLSQDLDNLTIGLMADFHRGRYTSDSDIHSAVELLQKENPDLILLAGDFVEGKAEYIHSVASILSKLVAPLGIFAVLGNHDYWTDSKLIRKVLEKFNIQVLINRAIELQLNNDSFHVVGLDDAWEGQPDYQIALKDIPEKEMKILMVHEPDYADFITCDNHWIPLQLSGHSHGGQVVIPFFGAPALPYMGKKYPFGLNKINNSGRYVYTTRGVGDVVPVRFNCRPEVTLLKLKRRSGSSP